MINQKNHIRQGRVIRALIPAILFLFVLQYNSKGQEVLLDRSQKADSSLVKAIKMYDNQIGRNSFLYSGKGYFDHHRSVNGHQFFVDDYWELGTVEYEGQYFDSVYIKYDIYEDKLLLEHFNSAGLMNSIELYSGKVSRFELFGHNFIRLESDTLINLKGGFYDNIYGGQNVQLISKRKKEKVRRNDVNSYGDEFLEKNKYFIRKGNEYFHVKSKKSVIKTLAEKKKEIKKFIRSNRLYFNKDREISLYEIVKFYDSLGT